MKRKYSNNKVSEDSIRKIVTYSCKSIGRYWGIEPLVEYIQSEIFLDRIVNIILEILDDPGIKGILNRINSDKSISKEQVKKINELSKKILKGGKSTEEQGKIDEEYKLKDKSLINIINIQKQMELNFRELYDRYIDEILKEQFKLKRYTKEENLERLIDTNQEILQLVNQKINEILYKNEVRKLEVEFAEKAVFNCEDVNINVLIEKIKELGILYNVKYTKDIQRISCLSKYINND